MHLGFGCLYTFFMFYFFLFFFFFFQKAVNNRLKKASWPKFCNIFYYCLKQGRSGPQTNKLIWPCLTLEAFGNINDITLYTKEGRKLNFPMLLVYDQRCIQNPVKHLCWSSQSSNYDGAFFLKIVNGFQSLAILAKSLITYV